MSFTKRFLEKKNLKKPFSNLKEEEELTLKNFAGDQKWFQVYLDELAVKKAKQGFVIFSKAKPRGSF